MVGVAGGSRGCMNCRRRRIKCDEQYPICKRCIKSNLTCDGPKVGPVFRRQRVGSLGFTVTEETVRSSESESQTGVTTPEMDGNDPQSTIIKMLSSARNAGSTISKLQEVWNYEIGRKDHGVIVLNSRLSPDMDSSLLWYFVKNFVSDSGYTSDRRFNELYNLWVPNLPRIIDLGPNSPACQSCRAIVLSFCAGALKDESLRMRSIDAYARALRLQKENVTDFVRELEEQKVAHKNRVVYDFETDSEGRGKLKARFLHSLIAAAFFILYEYMTPTDSVSWMTLANGIAGMLRLVGPVACQEGIPHRTYVSLRALLVICSILSHQDTFLSSREWREIPFQVFPKNIDQQLYDIALEIPKLEQVASKHVSLDPLKIPEDDSAWIRRECSKVRTKEDIEEMVYVFRALQRIDRQCDEWFGQYKASVKEHVHANYKQTDSMVFNEELGVLEDSTVRCTAVDSAEEWMRTHFFKPDVAFVSRFDYRTNFYYYSIRILLCILLRLCSPFAFMKDLKLRSLSETFKTTDINQYIEQVRYRGREFSAVVCRSSNLISSYGPGYQVANLQMCLRMAHSLLWDPLDLYWVEMQLKKLTARGFALGTAGVTNHAQTYLPLYDSLQTCPGCQEKLRIMLAD
ncbi:hypothetical protein V1511DRAFT_505507 [Dipodascopsis uninucleata]